VNSTPDIPVLKLLHGGHMSSQEVYLRAILATVARQIFSPEKILEIMGAQAREQHRKAYNMCDGTKTQSDVVKKLGIDHSNFSKTLARWVDAGICIRVGDGRDALPMHIYPLPESYMKKAPKQ
jgi:hypothetical protein